MPASDETPAPAAPERAKAVAGDLIDTRLVRRLADILNDTDLTEIEVERGELRIRVARTAAVAAAQVFSPMAASATPTDVHAAAGATAPPAAGMTTDTGPERRGEPVTSPMVGTVYLQPQPGAAPFVRVGDRVNEGQTLLLVEAMKTLNPIAAPRSGEVLEVLVQDAQPIEFGEPLMVIG